MEVEILFLANRYFERTSPSPPTAEYLEAMNILGYQNDAPISQALLDFKGAYAAYSYQDQSHTGYAPGPEWTFDPNGSWNDEVEGTHADTGFKMVSYRKQVGNQVEIMINFAGTEGGFKDRLSRCGGLWDNSIHGEPSTRDGLYRRHH